MLNRWVEDDKLLDTLDDVGMGSIVFSPLAQGMLSTKYLGGIPVDSRAAQNHFLKRNFIRPSIIDNIRKLNEIAEARGQTLAQMAIAWVLRGGRVTSALIGASRSSQIVDCVKALDNLEFTADELKQIDVYAREADINLWAKSAELE
jgi:L-glyceraldehyde 3-phosphate reductase